MTALAMVSEDVAALRAMAKRALDESTTLEQALNVRERARLVQEWTKIRSDAEHLRAEALRLECCALRRIGQLADKGWTKNVHLAKAARLFAEMSIDAFRKMLELVAEHASLSRLVAAINAEVNGIREETDRQWQLNQIANGTAIAPSIDRYGETVDYELEQLRGAAATLIARLAVESDSFTVADAARSLLASLAIHDASAAEEYATRELVREAITIQGDTREERWPGQPSFVTYFDGVLETWLRIPFHAASLSQLQFMVAYRREQVADYHAKTERLAAFAAILEAAAEGRPTRSRSLSDLLTAAERSVGNLRKRLTGLSAQKAAS